MVILSSLHRLLLNFDTYKCTHFSCILFLTFVSLILVQMSPIIPLFLIFYPCKIGTADYFVIDLLYHCLILTNFLKSSGPWFSTLGWFHYSYFYFIIKMLTSSSNATKFSLQLPSAFLNVLSSSPLRSHVISAICSWTTGTVKNKEVTC